MSRGSIETTKLKENIENQLKRLITQLNDIEEMKEELDEQEYLGSRQETIDQIKEFEVSLNNTLSGNISLVDSLGSVQLAIQAAIQSTTSPEILNMFIRKENQSMRIKLNKLDEEFRLGKINSDIYKSQVVEILKLLQKLGEPLSPRELELLDMRKEIKMEKAEDDSHVAQESSLLKSVSDQVTKSK